MQPPKADEPPKSRVDTEHGGELVEAVAQADLTSFNDAECEHKTLIRDRSEKDFIAFMCSNPQCNEVVLYS